MITYEEFLKENNIQDIKRLAFGQDNMLCADVTITEDAIKYIDIAKKAKNLRRIFIETAQNADYYDESLTEFIKNCNDEVTISNGVIGKANKEEYIKGEEIVKNILLEVDTEWTTKQKLAYVHYKMGKIISYIPDFNFYEKDINSPITNNARNIWKSLVYKKSVCNGIVNIQRNILSRLGIKTKELSSGTHSFLLTETEEGNIITDPTWDLSNTLYQARPQYFGITYDELRRREKGISNAHKLDNPPENVIEISENELREIYHSIGITNEDRTFKFPILEEVQKINEKKCSTLDKKIDNFLNEFSKKFSNEASHLAETRSLLEMAISELGVPSSEIRSKFIYSKEDKALDKPILMFYINSNNLENKIKVLDVDEMKFKNIGIKELDENYKSHDLDTAEPFWKKYIPNDIQIQQENER